MSQFIEIHWTCGSIDEARKVLRYLVQERLVACGQITPWLESVYMWDNKLETTQESKVSLKTRAELYDTVREVIEQNTNYEVPQITFCALSGGNPAYMEWMDESIQAVQKA
jgi:periplasmic divalent cation tolerance protein